MAMEWQFGIAEFSATNLPPMCALFGLFFSPKTVLSRHFRHEKAAENIDILRLSLV